MKDEDETLSLMLRFSFLCWISFPALILENQNKTEMRAQLDIKY